MAKHLEKGKFGEALAIEFLQKQGYEIIACNWRFKRLEVDVIAKYADVLVFVEVKTRSQLHYGTPDSFVDQRKQKLLYNAAEAYIELNHHEAEIRFDIISIYTPKNQATHIEHFKDAFWDYGAEY